MRKKYSKSLIVLLSLFFLILSGCNHSVTLLDPYTGFVQNEENERRNAIYFSDPASANLCVVEEEDSYDPNAINANAALLLNITDQTVLYSKNAFTQMPMASITKVMTALVAFRYGNMTKKVTLNDDVVITTNDAWLCKLEPGDQLTLDDLMRAMLVYSGNDAAVGVADAVADTLPNFVKMMNDEAAAINATATHYANPHGLDASGHYTTAYDIYLTFNECLKYDEFRQIIRLPSFSCDYKNSAGEYVTKTWTSGNSYINGSITAPPGIQVLGGKTGNTANAKRCLVLLSKDPEGKEYISIILGAEDKDVLYQQMNILLGMIL